MNRATPASVPGPDVRHRASRRESVVLVVLVVALAVVGVASLSIGSVPVPLARVSSFLVGMGGGGDAAAIVLHTIRLPRTVTAMLAGTALGVAGLQMQTLFRNPLADPFALGISAGASLGVALLVLGGGFGAMALFGDTLGITGDAALTVAATAGAVTVLGLVMALSRRIASAATLLIIGLMAGYAVSSFVTVLISATEPDRLQQWTAWGFGSFSGVTWTRLAVFGPVVASGVIVAVLTTKPLNALLLGDVCAHSMGVPVRRVRVVTMLGASVLGASVTAFCGPIGFLGMAVPHLARGLAGTADHRVLVPATSLIGAIVALSAQMVALEPGRAGILPLNAVTALIGAPIVVVVLLRERRRGGLT
jgi:iron complex transport system permease protein